MGLYIGTKLIKALVMTREAYNKLRGWEVPADENGDDEGFLVEYVDGGKANHPDFAGYISWSPKDVFERAYQATSGMDFGMALASMKVGKKIARSGWNGSGMFAYYVPSAKVLPCPHPQISEQFQSTFTPFRECLMLKTAQNDIAAWAPSVGDVLSTDWYVIE